MSKFKVIEESRFLGKEGMDEVKGGGICRDLPGGLTYYQPPVPICPPHYKPPCTNLHFIEPCGGVVAYLEPCTITYFQPCYRYITCPNDGPVAYAILCKVDTHNIIQV